MRVESAHGRRVDKVAPAGAERRIIDSVPPRVEAGFGTEFRILGRSDSASQIARGSPKDCARRRTKTDQIELEMSNEIPSDTRGKPHPRKGGARRAGKPNGINLHSTIASVRMRRSLATDLGTPIHQSTDVL